MSSVSLIAWLIAGVCFIFSLGGLSQHESSRRGNLLGIVGMTVAILAALFCGQVNGWILLMLCIAAGAVVGGVLAQRVEMTAMPQLVAILHSFVGLAAVLVGISLYLWPHAGGHLIDGSNPPEMAPHDLIHKIEIVLGVFIGGLTFTGSVCAWGKLDGRIASKPLLLPHRHLLNLAMLIVALLISIWFCSTASITTGVIALLLVMLISFVFGVHMVMAIGGADMPVVVSMLNSYSGWAAAATGFSLPHDLLIVTGALVGSSGAILSYIMCHAMM